MKDLRGLEEDRDHLLRSLDDLEEERAAGDIEEADYLALRDDYTARAAATLRALAQGRAALDAGATPAAGAPPGGATPAADGAPPGPATPAADGAPPAGAVVRPEGYGVEAGAGPRRSRWRPALVLGALVAFAVAAGALVARTAGERMPGDPATGSIAATGPSDGIARDLARARDLIGEGRSLDAIKLYDGVLRLDPEQPEALAYRGWLLRLAGRASGNTGLVDKGLEFIERAVAADPTYPDAHFFKAFILYQDRKDPAAAIPELRAFLANDPPRAMVPVVEDLLGRALADAGATAPATPSP
ncbi:MAG: tetratricopeptide repeat protein [Actinomycetota bacterium]